MISVLNISLIIGSEGSESPSLNSNPVNTMPDSTQMIGVQTLGQAMNVLSLVNNEKPSKVVYEMKCLKCLGDLPVLERDYELANSAFYENSLFKCPMERTKTFCYKCIDNLYKQAIIQNQSAVIECPSCRNDLKDAIENYRKSFVKKFTIDPKEKMIETLGLILSDFDGSAIVSANLIENFNFCKYILHLIQNLPGKHVEIIKKILRRKMLKLEPKKISIGEFQAFCFKLVEHPQSLCLTLQQSIDIIKLLTKSQVTELIQRISDIKFDKCSAKIKAMNFLFDYILEEKLINFDEENFFEISMIFLRCRSIEGLELFTLFNTKFPCKYNLCDVDKVFGEFNILKKQFESEAAFFEACKIFDHVDSNRKIELMHNASGSPPNLILEKKIEYLIEHFDEESIFFATATLVENPEITKNKIEFLFENDIFEKYPFILSRIIYIISISISEPRFRELFEYFMVKLLNNKSGLVDKLNESQVCILMHCCVFFRISANFLKPFESYIDNDLFNIVNLKSTEFAHTFFEMLGELKGDNFKDYQRLHLSSKLFYNRDNFLMLRKILKPESISPSLKIILETAENFIDLYNSSEQDLLHFFIKAALDCYERRELLNVLSSSISDEFKFLIKANLICIISKLIKERNAVNIKKKFMKYLSDHLEKTQMLEKVRQIFVSNSSVHGRILINELDFDELNKIAEGYEIDHLIDFFEEIIAFN